MLNEPALWADIVFPLAGSSSSNPSAPTEVLDSLPIQSTSIDTTALTLGSSESEVEMDYTPWDPSTSTYIDTFDSEFESYVHGPQPEGLLDI